MSITAEMRAEDSPGVRPDHWRAALLVATVELHTLGYGGTHAILDRLALGLSQALAGREVRWNFAGMEQGHYRRWEVSTDGSSHR